MGEHGHPRLTLHALDQGFAAARDDEVDDARAGEDGGDVGAVGVRGDLHGGFRQAGGGKAGDDRGRGWRGRCAGFRNRRAG